MLRNCNPFNIIKSRFTNLSVIFILFCISGMCYHQYFIVQQYLQYKVNTAIGIYIPNRIDSPSLTFCFTSHVLNLTQLNMDTESNWTTTSDYDELIQNNTAFNLFKSMPDPRNVVKLLQYSYVPLNVSNLNITRFFFGWSICYNIPKLYLEESSGLFVKDASIKGQIGYLELNTILSKTVGIRFAFGVHDVIPYRGIIMSRYFNRHAGGTGRSEVLYSWNAHYYAIEMRRLPSPYETQCFDYKTTGIRDDVECVFKCFLKAGIQKLKAIPSPTFVLHSLNYTTADYGDRKMWKQMLQMRKDCEKQCWKPPCNDTQIVTLANDGVPYYENSSMLDDSESITFSHEAPGFPFFNVNSRPAQSTVDLFLFIFSTISTWTGVSIVSMNPLRFFHSLHLTRGSSTTGVWIIPNRRMRERHNRLSPLLTTSNQELSQQVRNLRHINNYLVGEIRLIKNIVRLILRMS